MSCPIITLTTDFGLKDPYVAEMKAAILSISRKAAIVDVTHEMEKFNIRMAAFVLASASPFFPENTIHMAVVDPRVGTERRSLLIQTKKAFYIGPDNGVLALAANNQRIEHIYEITNRKFMHSRISNTFHGRDVFAPSAAHLANGRRPTEFGPEIHKIATPSYAKVVKKKNTLVGEVVHIDSFGNIITNIQEKELKSWSIEETVEVTLNNTKLRLKLCRAYAEMKMHEPLAVIGSYDFLEISICQGNAAKTFGTKNSDQVTLHLLKAKDEI